MDSHPIPRRRKSKAKKHEQIDWRRGRVAELSAQGHSIREIGSMLKVSMSLISLDIQFLKQQAKDNIKNYEDRLSYEYEKCLTGITTIMRQAFLTSSEEHIPTREKLQALSLAKDCSQFKLDLITNVGVVDSAVKFIEQKKRESIPTIEEEEEVIERYNNKKKRRKYSHGFQGSPAIRITVYRATAVGGDAGVKTEVKR
jgi:hypothetical protein